LRPRLDHRQAQSRTGTANVLPLRRESRLDIFFELLWPLEEHVIDPVVLVFANRRGIAAADFWPRIIDPAEVVALQLPANSMHLQVPGFLFHKDAGVLVQQEPAQRIEITP